MNQSFRNFSEFWPYYLAEHSKPGTRYCHFVGTSLLFICLVLSVLYRSLLTLPAGIIPAYGSAWFGHFFIERNRPATFRYPFLSLLGDFKMYFWMLSGRDFSTETRKALKN